MALLHASGRYPQNIDAGLPVLGPVISQARHGIHPGQPDSRWLVITQLVGCCSKSFVQRPGALLRQCATGDAPGRPETESSHNHCAAEANKTHNASDERRLYLACL